LDIGGINVEAIKAVLKGLIFAHKGNLQEATNSMMEAIKIAPEYYEAHYHAGRFLAELGNYDEAIEHLNKVHL